MTCEQAIHLINSRLDGQISREELDALESHLEACSACREDSEALTSQHALLQRGFDEHRATASRIAENVIVELPRGRRLRIPIWLSMLTSAAAGFAIAWLIFHTTAPAPQPPQANSQTSPAAHLTLATGAVEAADSSGKNWSPLPTGGAIEPGARLRTGPGVRCELLNADGSQLRLNEKTEIVLTAPRKFELVDGQTWSTVAHDSAHPYQALAAAVTFTALGTQFDLRASPTQHDATLTVVEGSVRVDAAGASRVVSSGSVFTCPDGHLGDQKPARDLARATRWLNEILVMKGRDDPELTRRVNDLFARIGKTKMDSLYEDEIRALGDHCVVPLTRYIESTLWADEPHKRVLAAKIVADVATTKSIPDLLPLLQDSDGQVRAAAASALQRLTGETMGRSIEKWRDDTLLQCTPTAQKWTNWWDKNKTLYPGVADKPAGPRNKL